MCFTIMYRKTGRKYTKSFFFAKCKWKNIFQGCPLPSDRILVFLPKSIFVPKMDMEIKCLRPLQYRDIIGHFGTMNTKKQPYESIE